MDVTRDAGVEKSREWQVLRARFGPSNVTIACVFNGKDIPGWMEERHPFVIFYDKWRRFRFYSAGVELGKQLVARYHVALTR